MSEKIELSTTPDDLAREGLDRWAMQMKKTEGHLPLILHEECYEFFGEAVEVVEANVFDDVKNAEVVVRARFGQVHQTEFSEISWRYGRRYMQRIQNGEIVSQ